MPTRGKEKQTVSAETIAQQFKPVFADIRDRRLSLSGLSTVIIPSPWRHYGSTW